VIVLALGLVAQIPITFALFRWGRRIAERRPGAFWRWAARAPFLPLCLALIAGAWSTLIMSRVFAQVATSDPSVKATALARGISETMNCAALLEVPAMLLYVACVVTLLIGSARD